MTALLAILLQVGPPTPACTVSHTLTTGTAAPCDGVLIPAVEAASSTKLCDLRVDTAERIGDARVKACSASVELLHVTLGSVRDIFEASQDDSTARLAAAEAPEPVSWWQRPGWGTVIIAGAAGAVTAWAVMR